MEFLSRGVYAGYLVLGVAYPNDDPIGNKCRQPGANINCYWDSRLNIILGQPFQYSAYKWTQSDSIVWRIYQLMQYIQNSCIECSAFVKQYISNVITSELPYLPPMYGTGIDWTKLTISGHSQGAGHAVAIGYLYNTSRIISLSGSTDFPVGSTNYRWSQDLSDNKNTSANRFFGLVAYNEEASQYIVDNWQATPYSSPEGRGPVVVPTSQSHGYTYSHQLCSTLPNNCIFSHGSTGKDTRLSDVWSYMLTTDINVTPSNSELLSAKICQLKPCNPGKEKVVLIILLVLMGIVPVVVLYLEQRFYFKIPINTSTEGRLSRIRKSPRRYFYLIQLGCLLVSWGLGFMCFWLYVSENQWEEYTDVIKIDIGILVGVTALGSISSWVLNKYKHPTTVETASSQDYQDNHNTGGTNVQMVDFNVASNPVTNQDRNYARLVNL